MRHDAGMFGLLVLGVSLAVGPAFAQSFQGAGGLPAEGASPSAPVERNTFGVGLVAHTLQAFAFQPFNAAFATLLNATSTGSRNCTASCFLEAPLLIPAGARIDFLELDACDSDVAGVVTVELFRVDLGGAIISQLASGSTSLPGAPGCTLPLAILGTPETVDNRLYSYFIQVALSGGTSATSFQAVRVGYTLQVSPAPGTATFADVPLGHALHPFVEALSAAGITAGCGGGNFCPNDSITRGQMAVFLAKALGLHWAP